MARPLLGPPEIRLPTLPTISTTTTTNPPMGFTENNSATYLATGNPCLDFFFHVVPDTPPEQLVERLVLAWDRNALTSLKLVCNLRGVRGTGKSDKEGFYAAALYNRDPEYRFLHDRVSDLFAELLKSDMESYRAGELCKIGLAAKWCPNLDSSFDQATLICESVARSDSWSIGKGEEREEHDRAGALLPHEIIESLNDWTGSEVAELQWKRMVDDMAKKGKLTNCMSVCDVSGSMSGIPMEVSVALGLLISELSEEPWKGKVITFSANPQLHTIEGDSLRSKTSFIRRMDWGANTDFQKVFDRILEVAVEGKLREDQMIKTLFVFSDMEFDQASGSSSYNYYGSGYHHTGSWETDYTAIQRKFKEKGYERVPEIVFWNLRNSDATPVPSKQEGVALVSGYSKNLMTLFLDGEAIMSPEAVMLKAISGEEYQKLVVLD
ncbi:hypothetical protein C3L33_15061, partial [Rhododendron williamsianum]